MSWTMWMGLALGLLAIALVAVSAYGALRWNKLARDLIARPLTDGARIVSAVTVEHADAFNMGETGELWKPFRSIQRVVTRRPGFVWDGRITIVPGLAVRVHDAYIAGEGVLHPAILGLFSLIDLRGGCDLAKGGLMRYFAEAVWYPTALLPSQGVLREAVDERSAKATLADETLKVTLSFRFGDDDLIESLRAEARGRAVAGKVVPAPWEGRWSNYEECSGMRVPTIGEVACLLPEGRKPYWRATITSLAYEF